MDYPIERCLQHHDLHHIVLVTVSRSLFFNQFYYF